jgi:hypothetical protein
MMKFRNLSFITVLIILVFGNNFAYAQYNRKSQGLTGKVKSYTENFFNAVQTDKGWEKGELQRFAKHKATFDQNGRILSNAYYDSTGQVTMKLRYKYKSKKQIEQLQYGPHQQLKNKTRINRVSDTKSTYRKYNLQGDLERAGTTFYENSRLVKSVTKRIFDSASADTVIREVSYNGRGFTSAGKQYIKGGEVLFDHTFEYLKTDKNGNWIKKMVYKAGHDAPFGITTRTYTYY